MHRVRQDVRDQLRAEAAHPHSQQRETVPVRGLLQGVHPVLQSMPAQTHARRLPYADQVREMRPVVQHGHLLVQA